MDMSEPSVLVPQYTGIKQKVLELLGSSQLAPSVVADAVGVDQSYITQLLAQEEFAKAVTQLRFEKLQKASSIDAKYEDLELKLVEKLEDILWTFTKPAEILAAIRIINSTKRRGVGFAPSNVTNVQVVNVIIPTKLLQRFRVNEQNQVIEADGQTLTTIASNVLLNQVENETKRLALADAIEK